jgi:hypothetical protein
MNSAIVSTVTGWAVTVWRLFVADSALAGFVVCWMALCWFAGGRLGATALGALLAIGPIVALWWSVRHAARTIRRAQLEDK